MCCVSASFSDFTVQRYVGRGCYSVVFEVRKQTGNDVGSRYALKRFFLENESSVKCVLRERNVLEQLAVEEHQSPFLPMLFYGIWENYISSFILREGTGCDLYDLLRHAGQLSETDAKFYLTEIICGLEHLHSMEIVHLDIKPENVLFYSNGHIFLSDLDRSYDLKPKAKPTLDDFTGTPLFMAPEIARGEMIDKRADVWSLGVLVAEMVSGPIRPRSLNTAEEFKKARMGTYSIRGLKRFTKPLQSFFSATLQRDYKQRPNLSEVKQLRFLKSIDWFKAYACNLRPPYKASEIRHRLDKINDNLTKSTDCLLLSGVFQHNTLNCIISSKHANKIKLDPLKYPEVTGAESFILSEELQSRGFTMESVNAMFQRFTFVHPSLCKITEISLENGIKRLLDEKVPITAVATEKHVTSSSTFHRTRTRGTSIGD